MHADRARERYEQGIEQSPGVVRYFDRVIEEMPVDVGLLQPLTCRAGLAEAYRVQVRRGFFVPLAGQGGPRARMLSRCLRVKALGFDRGGGAARPARRGICGLLKVAIDHLDVQAHPVSTVRDWLAGALGGGTLVGGAGYQTGDCRGVESLESVNDLINVLLRLLRGGGCRVPVLPELGKIVEGLRHGASHMLVSRGGGLAEHLAASADRLGLPGTCGDGLLRSRYFLLFFSLSCWVRRKNSTRWVASFWNRCRMAARSISCQAICSGVSWETSEPSSVVRCSLRPPRVET